MVAVKSKDVVAVLAACHRIVGPAIDAITESFAGRRGRVAIAGRPICGTGIEGIAARILARWPGAAAAIAEAEVDVVPTGRQGDGAREVRDIPGRVAQVLNAVDAQIGVVVVLFGE